MSSYIKSTKKSEMPYLNIQQSILAGPPTQQMTISFDIKILPSRDLMSKPFYGIWLLDTSGSMEGEKFDSAIGSLKEQVNSLPEGTIFTLIGFGPVKTYFEEKKITEESKAKIIRKLDKLTSRGLTPMYKAMKKALGIIKNYRGKLETKKIILITDGLPTDKESSESDPNEKNFREFIKLAQEIREYHVSIDTVGALHEHNVLLLYEIARQTAGKYIFADSARELKEKMTIASQQATHILFPHPTLTIRPLSGWICKISDSVQYKPTIIRMPFEYIKGSWKAWLRPFEAGDTYQILFKIHLEQDPKAGGKIALIGKMNLLEFKFNFDENLKTEKFISVTFTDNQNEFRMNPAINRQYVQLFDAAEEISDATLKGDAARTQRIQGDETKKIVQ